MAGGDDACQRRPVGLLAALLAVTITIGGMLIGQGYAIRYAGQYLEAINSKQLPIKWESLTFQRAAYASGDWLPIYGSSELYYCGDPFRGIQLFATMPSGFDLFAAGRAGTADLLFAETFAALGADLRGKKLVISDSPPWFFSRDGQSAKAYAGNFSPEIADAVAFTAPISLPLRQGIARRMLAYPTTLAGRPLLRLALENLANGTPLRLAAYYALAPAGRLHAFVQQIRDAYHTVQFIRHNPQYQKNSPPSPAQLNWSQLVVLGTSIAEERSGLGPFGFPRGDIDRLRNNRQYRQAVQLYCSGQSNRDGHIYGYPADWEHTMLQSAEWTDLQLELQTLNELGAQPLAVSLPMPGLYDDYTNISKAARDGYYQKYMTVTAPAAGLLRDRRGRTAALSRRKS